MEALFRIVTLKTNKEFKTVDEIKESDFYDLGTGFFVTKDGYFITAGHVIKTISTNLVFGIYNDKIYEIHIFTNTYLGRDLYKKRINDYVFGKINLIINNPFVISENFPKERGTVMHILGFTKCINKEPDTYNTYIEQYKLTKIHCKLYNSECIKPKEIFDEIEYGGFLENAFEVIYNERLKIEPLGVSGGPIINDSNEVIGILIRGNVCWATGIIMDDAIEDMKKIKN